MSAPFTSGRRLARGGLIDRSKSLRFKFDGRDFVGHPGDTLASALVANGVRLVGRSFKYHRPRGIVSAGSEEPNALVELGRGARRDPNTRATAVELYEGLEAGSQNRWPSLRFDLLSLNGLFAPVIAAGFYYKTFMWPPAFWEWLYEPLIRRAAGLGRASGEPDPDAYEHAFAFCDVLVIGAGPAGLAAALTAERAGARVILADEDFRPGGRLLADLTSVDDCPGDEWAQDAWDQLAASPRVRLFPRSTVFGVYDDGVYGMLERVCDHLPQPPPHWPRQRLWTCVAKRGVLAAGSLERPIAFGDNDRPGIMLASAARAYINRYAAAPGRRLAMFTATDDAWSTAFAAAGAGVEVPGIVDVRADPPAGLVARAHKLGIPVFAFGRVVAVNGGRDGVYAVTVAYQGGRRVRLECDALAVSGGWNPTIALTCHLGGKPVWNEALAAFVAAAVPPGLSVAGSAAGIDGLRSALANGVRKGAAAAADCGFAGRVDLTFTADDEPSGRVAFWRVTESRGKAFVDQQNDVTVDDVALAHREGYRAVELLKRYTTLGMATDQGKTSNVNAVALMAELTGLSIPETGTTVFRPPFTPVAISAFAGSHRGKDFQPTRLPPSHAWAEEQGAVFVETGLWLRAQWYPMPGERDWLEVVAREVRAVRSGVGFCDVSTLGKIDVQGPDAATLLDRVYVNLISTLPVGRSRYGLMLREDGFLMDDGTTARLGPDHFVMTTTTANAVKVMQHLDFCRQVLWPDLDVQIATVTDQWAQYSIAGPNARALLQKLVGPGENLSNQAFPFLAAADVDVCGVPGRLFRISFSGELAYELAVPARYGDPLAREIQRIGNELGVSPYGTEALGVMRVEKGHPAGAELNGTTTAYDLGLGRMLSTKKDFVGRRMAMRDALNAPDRFRLVGFKPVSESARLRAGAHFIGDGKLVEAANDDGYMTSVVFSPMLRGWIGLGLLKRGPERIGEKVRAVDLLRGEEAVVEVCDPVFYDKLGERQRA